MGIYVQENYHRLLIPAIYLDYSHSTFIQNRSFVTNYYWEIIVGKRNIRARGQIIILTIMFHGQPQHSEWLRLLEFKKYQEMAMFYGATRGVYDPAFKSYNYLIIRN